MPFRIVRNTITKMHMQTILPAEGLQHIAGESVEDNLRACYRESLQSAKVQGLTAVAVPLIRVDGTAYPKEEGMRIAVDEIRAFLLAHEMQVYLVVNGSQVAEVDACSESALEDYIAGKYVATQQLASADYMPVPDGECRMTFASAKMSQPMVAQPRVQMEQSVEVPKGRGFLGKLFGAKASECGAVPLCAEFDEAHESKLDERMQHLSDTFSQYLLYLIAERHMENADVWKRAIVDKKVFSKIKNNPDYHPQKMTALCLCIGAMLNLDESKDLLARAGYALSPCDKTDIIFSYFIENEIYDMIELDIQLEEHGLPCIIS